jgi:hypothetical protein
MVEEGARHGGEAALCVPELVTTLKAGTKKMITRGRGYGGKGGREKARARANRLLYNQKERQISPWD